MNISEIKADAETEPAQIIFSKEHYQELTKKNDFERIHGLIRTLPPLHQTVLNILWGVDFGVTLKYIRDIILQDLSADIYKLWKQETKHQTVTLQKPDEKEGWKKTTATVLPMLNNLEYLRRLFPRPFKYRCFVGETRMLGSDVSAFIEGAMTIFHDIDKKEKIQASEFHEKLSKLLTKCNIEPKVPSYDAIRNVLHTLRERGILVSIPAGKSKASEYWSMSPSFYALYKTYKNKITDDLDELDEQVKITEKKLIQSKNKDPSLWREVEKLKERLSAFK